MSVGIELHTRAVTTEQRCLIFSSSETILLLKQICRYVTLSYTFLIILDFYANKISPGIQISSFSDAFEENKFSFRNNTTFTFFVYVILKSYWDEKG